jgi:hypothetical protein
VTLTHRYDFTEDVHMFTIARSSFTIVAFASAFCVTLASCDDPPSVPVDPVEVQLDSLRAATQSYQELDAAQRAGWDLQFTPCMKHETGAMGFHYVKQSLLDKKVSVTQPEALLFEPGADGKLRLVAVEYLIPFTEHAADQPPPTLYGKPFSPSPTFKVWGLHAWIWKENPAGTFAPWNPSVMCR